MAVTFKLRCDCVALFAPCVVFFACDSTLDSLGTTPILPTLIDDLEDGDAQIPDAFGRKGGWYRFNDGTPNAEQCWQPTADVKTAERGRFVAHTHGSGFEDWGAGLGVTLANDSLETPYPAAAKYQGIRFWLKVKMEGGDPSLDINFPTAETSCATRYCRPNEGSGRPATAGPEAPATASRDLDPGCAPLPSCLPPPLGMPNEPERGDECDRHFGYRLELESEQWQQCTVLFEDLTQRNKQGVTIPQASFPAERFRDIQFLVPQDRVFDIWVDNVEFIEKLSRAGQPLVGPGTSCRP